MRTPLRRSREPFPRRILQVGGLSLVPLGLPTLLWADGQPPAEEAAPRTGRVMHPHRPAGGPSHLDIWDLKPDAPAEIRGPYPSDRHARPGIQVCEHLPRLAQLADRYCLIRSMRQPERRAPRRHAHLPERPVQPAGKRPYLGSIVARIRPATANIPSYVWLQNMEYDAGPRYQSGGLPWPGLRTRSGSGRHGQTRRRRTSP